MTLSDLSLFDKVNILVMAMAIYIVGVAVGVWTARRLQAIEAQPEDPYSF